MNRNVDELRARIEELETLALEQRDALELASEALDDYSDVSDGDEVSGPIPNKAMSVGEAVDNALVKAVKVLGV